MDGTLALGALFGGLVTTILWIAIGWRAMKAHERLAEDVRKIARHETGEKPIRFGG